MKKLRKPNTLLITTKIGLVMKMTSTPYGDKDIEHLDNHIEIGIERDREAKMRKGAHIARRECAPIGADCMQVGVALRETDDMASKDEKRIDEKANQHEPGFAWRRGGV